MEQGRIDFGGDLDQRLDLTVFKGFFIIVPHKPHWGYWALAEVSAL